MAEFTIFDGSVNQLVFTSTNNSSTSTLTASSVFTGTSDSTIGYGAIQVNAFSDVASAASGLSIQQSSNGTNWDIVDTFAVRAGQGFSTTVQATASFVRVVYTNGATNQASFRLQTILRPIVEALPRALTQSGSQRVADIGSHLILDGRRVTTGSIAGTAGAQNLFALANPAASGKFVIVKHIRLSSQAVAASAVKWRYLVTKGTTISGGSTLTSLSVRPQPLSSASGVATQAPTTINGLATNPYASAFGPAVITAAGYAFTSPVYVFGETGREDSYVMLDEGECVAVTADANDTDLSHCVSIFWEECPKF